MNRVSKKLLEIFLQGTRFRDKKFESLIKMPHQWEMPGSIPGRTCRPSRSEFSVVFFRSSLKYGLGSLRKARRAFYLQSQVSSGQLDLNLQSTNQPNLALKKNDWMGYTNIFEQKFTNADSETTKNIVSQFTSENVRCHFICKF